MIKDASVQRVLEAARIEDVISGYTSLRKRGVTFSGLCPFHQEKTPSFSVNADKGLYYCFGCGAKGDVITFVREMEHLDFVGAVEPHTTGPAEFAQWYHDVPGVNMAFPYTISLADDGHGTFGFSSDAFFPIDGKGFGNEGLAHNFHFTTEVHTTFKYKGGEIFRFTGDDDLWLFINGKLAIDLGGLHPQLSSEVNLDAKAAELGIVKGGTYKMDIFHAERHTEDSNFKVETTIDCFIIG